MNFVVFSLLGVIYESFLTIVQEFSKKNLTGIFHALGDEPAKITKAYITDSSYWLSWYP